MYLQIHFQVLDKPYMHKPQGHGKEKNSPPPLKNSQKFFPPGLRGCPCGDFPPPF